MNLPLAPDMQFGLMTAMPDRATVKATVGLLETNARFVHAYMCGANHAFAGELLWREYPTDQRGTYFRRFWDRWEAETARKRFCAPNALF